MVGVSPFKGPLMDEILDAEYKVVEHQIAPPNYLAVRFVALSAARMKEWVASPACRSIAF